MTSRHPLDILFLTNFSDYCYRTIPAIAQLADVLSVRLTLMHAFNPQRMSQDNAERQIHSFYPEADRYRSCQRRAVPGSLLDAVRQYVDVWPVNLIVAPTAGPLGLPRVGRRSVRTQLIETCGIPIWTIGRRADVQKLLRPMRNVACWLDFRSDQTTHLTFAIEYAMKMQANLHLLHALPMVDEGMLYLAVGKPKALHPDLARDELSRLCSEAPVIPQIHVCSGEGRAIFARMVRQCDADIVFLGDHEPLLRKWIGWGPYVADFIPCPAVYISNNLSIPVWNLEAIEEARSRVPGIGTPRPNWDARTSPYTGSRSVSQPRLVSRQ